MTYIGKKPENIISTKIDTTTGTFSGEVDAGSLDISGNADIDGTLEADAITIDGTAIASVLSPIAGSSSIVTTGALNAGSITSGFGNINIGSSTITTTGAVGTGDLTATGAFTSLGIDDNADATAITIDSSEQIGIGTASPSQLLHLKSTTNAKPNLLIETENAGANGGRLDFLHKSSSPADGDLLGDITFGGYSDDGTPPSDFARYVMIKAFASDVSNNAEKGRLTFSLHNGASNENNVDVLTLNGDKTGIGTTTPARQFTVQNTIANSGGELGILSSDSSTTGAFGTIHFGNNTDTSLASIRAKADGSTTSGKLEFNTEPNGGAIETRMTITSAGLVGINQGTPLQPLHLTDADFAFARFQTTAVSKTGMDIGQHQDGRGQINLRDSNDFTISTGDTERMRILSTGQVLIGSTSSSASADFDNLLVGSTGDTSGITILSSGSATAGIAFADPAESVAHSIVCHHADNTMRFNVHGNTERMRLTSGGAMTMGTTSSLTDVSGITLKHDDAGAYPTMMFLQNQPGSGGTMGSQIHMGYAADYGSILRFYGNPFSSRPGGFQFRRVTGSGTSDLSMQIGTDGRVKIPNAYTETTGNSANLFVDTDGRLIRATSSERYKNTITDATHGLTELLKLRSVTYKGNNDGDTIFGGLIAEEVHDAGLTEFVQYNDEDKPDALAYGNMVSLCIKAIQELKAENTALANRITTLEGE